MRLESGRKRKGKRRRGKRGRLGGWEQDWEMGREGGWEAWESKRERTGMLRESEAGWGQRQDEGTVRVLRSESSRVFSHPPILPSRTVSSFR